MPSDFLGDVSMRTYQHALSRRSSLSYSQSETYSELRVCQTRLPVSRQHRLPTLAHVERSCFRRRRTPWVDLAGSLSRTSPTSKHDDLRRSVAGVLTGMSASPMFC